VYQQFMADPERTAFVFSQGVTISSMKRVDAILRLKGLEEHWKTGSC